MNPPGVVLARAVDVGVAASTGVCAVVGWDPTSPSDDLLRALIERVLAMPSRPLTPTARLVDWQHPSGALRRFVVFEGDTGTGVVTLCEWIMAGEGLALDVREPGPAPRFDA